MNGRALRVLIGGRLHRVVGPLAVLVGLGAVAGPAMAVSGGEAVSGTTLSSISLTASSGAVFTTNFSPGNTATATGALTAADTNSSWTLQVEDTAASNAGKMKTAALGCTGSDAALANPLNVSVTAPVSLPTGGGVTTTSPVSLSGTNQTVASATSQLLAADVFTTNYSQTIPSSEVMLTGCVYSVTATYTLQ